MTVEHSKFLINSLNSSPISVRSSILDKASGNGFPSSHSESPRSPYPLRLECNATNLTSRQVPSIQGQFPSFFRPPKVLILSCRPITLIHHFYSITRSPAAHLQVRNTSNIYQTSFEISKEWKKFDTNDVTEYR